MRLPAMVRTAFIILALLASRAYAGLDCDDATAIKQLEAFAADKTKADAMVHDYTWICVDGLDQRFKPRLEKACRKILDRDGDGSECVTAVAAVGIGKLGDHDIFTLVTQLPENPIEASGGIGYYKAALLARIGDPRGAQVLVDIWKATIAKADAREKKHWEMASWSGWRQYTAEALGKLGDADTKTFLEEQAKATKDTHVRDACNDAAAAIAKRLAKP